MTKRALCGRDVNPIGLGCMNMSWAYGKPPERADAVRAFQGALDAGYDHLDTANIYGLGHNEELLAEAVMHRRADFFLATKMGIVIDGPNRGIDCSPDAIMTQIDGSLKRLGTDYIDLYYMHRFDPKVPIADSVGAMARLIEAGKIGSYGVSEWSAAHIEEAHAVCPMGAVQTEYSLWTRNPELAVLETCKRLGIAFVAFSPVGRGALCGPLDVDGLSDKDLRRLMPRFTAEHWPANRQILAGFEALAAEAGMTPAQMSLAWVLAQGEHVHAIPGTRALAHMQENLAAHDMMVAPEILAHAGELINHGTVSGHRYAEMMRATIDTEDFG